MNQRLFSALLALAMCCATTTVATAQIYVSRDANGTIVLSDKPLGADAVTYAVPKAAGVRTTRSVATFAGGRYDDIIAAHAATHSVRPELVRAVIAVESAFNPRARSPKGAMGLMQLMPATARDLGVERPYDPDENIRGGVAYLRSLLDRYRDNEELALAAYNAGPGAVDKYGQAIPPYRETRDYVRRIKDRTEVSVQARAHVPRIYRVTEVIDGREVMRYTNVRPTDDSPYELVSRHR